MKKNKLKKIILIASDGGHLAQILELKEMFSQYNYLLVTEKTLATLPLQENYNIRFLHGRSMGKGRGFQFLITLVLNSFLSLKLLLTYYPKVIITTGSHTAVPMCFLGKLLGVKIIWILSFARTNSKSFSADVIYPIADKFIVQWPGVQSLYKKSIYLGGIY